MDILSFLFLSVVVLLFFFQSSNATDIISSSDYISDGSTLISLDGSFELGFFSPGSSKNRYVGIWYKNIPVNTVVWVGNRRSPINDSSGLLMINSEGRLVLLVQNKTVVWSSSISKKKEARKPILQLLDSGNLVLRNENDTNTENYLWQSFDYPTDTMLPGMKLGWDLKTNLERHLYAWKSSDDPSPGDLNLGIVLNSYPESVLFKGVKKYHRSGPWNGLAYSGAPELKPNTVYDYQFVNNEEEVYYSYTLKNKSVISRVVLNESTSTRQRYTWSEATQSWKLYTSVPRDLCDNYGLCGAYGNCMSNESPYCQCLKGFTPASLEEWQTGDWSGGCTRNKPLNCQSGDEFVKFSGLKLPDTTYTWVNRTMNMKECRAECLHNCSCMAYTNFDIRGGGSGCVLWFDDLIDIRQFPEGGQDLHIRMSASELERKDEVKMEIAVTTGATIAIALGMIVAGYYIRKSMVKDTSDIRETSRENNVWNEEKEQLELPIFDLATIAIATKNFSTDNKVGEGGFGPVYKGTLDDGQDIAVKRLSLSSGQGLNEFKNEVILFSKLQHRDLVKLLGCCIHGEERMLIYEYMPNKSLDLFIFDQARSGLLDWSKRFNIICGIARGLLYLHQDSRLRVIHRDLKASNILLDHKMNPKISDFGMARIFGGNQTEGNTSRVVGTYGYMAPEYATDGLFSVKSDVFSFGIIMLEIISGKKSKGFFHPDHNLNLIGYAWRLWKESKALELIDTSLRESCNLLEVMRCIHISLLCVQQHPEDRPSMATVVWMLGRETILPQPKHPGFFKDKGPAEPDSSSSNHGSSSTNEITITQLEPR